MGGGGVLSHYGSKYMLPIGTRREEKDVRFTSVYTPRPTKTIGACRDMKKLLFLQRRWSPLVLQKD